MSKKKEFIVPMYYKIKAESYEDAEIIADNLAHSGIEPDLMVDTSDIRALKGKSQYIGDLQ